MELEEALTIYPGDKVIFVHPNKDKIVGSGVTISANHTPTPGILLSGNEYVVSYLFGLNDKSEAIFQHLVKDEPKLNDPNGVITHPVIYLEDFNDAVDYRFLEKKRPTYLDVGHFTMNQFFNLMGSGIIQGSEYLAELIDKDCGFNLYDLPLRDYYTYLDLEIDLAQKTDMSIAEKAIEIYNSQLDEGDVKGRKTLNQEYPTFLLQKKERQGYFEGIRNICDVLEKEYNAVYYGDIIQLFNKREVNSSTIKEFYENLWLTKKEFQITIIKSYNALYPQEAFFEYKW